VEIIEARLEEILNMVNSELKKISRDGKLPAGIVLTGGGANLPGVADFAKKHLRLPVTIGKLQNISTIIDRVQDPSFATVSGLALWGEEFGHASGDSLSSVLNKFLKHPKTEKVKSWFKSFLP
jgi:cell division protein FtsA